MATTGYQAGIESNAVQISYGVESAYGVAPATTFKAIRLTSESMSGNKTRNRPAELQSLEVSQSVTTQEAAGGSINYALSFGTFDDLFASGLNSAWQGVNAVSLTAGSLGIAVTTGVVTAASGTPFTNVALGQWISLSGFANANNNGVFKVIAKASASVVTLAPGYTQVGVVKPFVSETPAGVVKLGYSTMVNSTAIQTLFVQKRLASAIWLRYPGAFISGFTVTGGTGQFLNGAFNVLPIQEVQNTGDASTGGITAAPTNRVMDPVNSFIGVYLNEVPVPGVVDSFTLTVANDGAALEYGMGGSAARGILAGLMMVTGTLKMYFSSLTAYNLFKSETQGILEFVCGDNVGNTYVFSILNAALMNPKVVAGTQNSAVFATFDIEGNPQSGGGTIQIDRLGTF